MSAQPVIGGSTRLYAIIGDPIAQVKSPALFNPRLAAAGRDAVLVPMHVRPERFEETMRALMGLANLDGLVITVPYKARALALVDRPAATAARVGAVNAMRRDHDGRWSGDMFDGRGLIRGLHAQGIDLAGRRVLLIGTGGAGSAVADALAEAGAGALTLHDADEARAKALAARIAAAYPGCTVAVAPPSPAGHDVLVNATPVGMAAGDGLPVPLPRLDPAMLVIDIIAKPEVTPLLSHAAASGCRTIGGRTMLEGQIEEVLQFFGMAE